MDVAADSAAVSDAAIALLEAEFVGVPEWDVFDAEAGEGAQAPYLIVYPVSDVPTGTIASPSADMGRTVQVNSVGTSRWQAQWGADLAMRALCGANHREVVIEGRALSGAIRHMGGRWLGRDTETAGPTLFVKSDDYLFATTPKK